MGTCVECRYYRKTPLKPNEGTCRYNPPTMHVLPMANGGIMQFGAWPPVASGEWCSKYEWDVLGERIKELP